MAATKGQPPVDTTFTVINDALVWIDEGKIDKTIKPRGYSLADVPAGAIVTLRQSLDQKQSSRFAPKERASTAASPRSTRPRT